MVTVNLAIVGLWDHGIFIQNGIVGTKGSLCETKTEVGVFRERMQETRYRKRD